MRHSVVRAMRPSNIGVCLRLWRAVYALTATVWSTMQAPSLYSKYEDVSPLVPLIYRLALRGINVCAQNAHGNTCLHLACIRPHADPLQAHLIRIGKCTPSPPPLQQTSSELSMTIVWRTRGKIFSRGVPRISFWGYS